MRNNGLLRSAADTIRRFAMLRPGERVLVALSGGADSVSLLLVLQKLGYAARSPTGTRRSAVRCALSAACR